MHTQNVLGEAQVGKQSVNLYALYSHTRNDTTEARRLKYFALVRLSNFQTVKPSAFQSSQTLFKLREEALRTLDAIMFGKFKNAARKKEAKCEFESSGSLKAWRFAGLEKRSEPPHFPISKA